MIGSERNANVFTVGVERGIAVVADVTGVEGEDGVVPTHARVFAGEPKRAALTVDDHAGFDLFTWREGIELDTVVLELGGRWG